MSEEIKFAIGFILVVLGSVALGEFKGRIQTEARIKRELRGLEMRRETLPDNED